MTLRQVLARLRSLGRRENVAGMARYGIRPKRAFGLTTPQLRALAREIGRDHPLAGRLWATGIHEARLLAAMVEDSAEVSETQAEGWVRQLDSWALCDCCCLEVFRRLTFAHRKAIEWSGRREELVKRCGFALMAVLAVHDKAAPDGAFQRFLPLIRREAVDQRNLVKKAVNWALRQIGKRNHALNRASIRTAEQIRRLESRGARWIAADALRELRSPSVTARLAKTSSRPVR